LAANSTTPPQPPADLLCKWCRPKLLDPRCWPAGRGCRPFAALQWPLEARFQGASGLSVDAHRRVTINIDGPPPSSARDWLFEAVDQLKAAPDCPTQVTEAAQRLEAEMRGAFLRRQCDEAWGWGAIKNNLITWDLWPRKRPQKG